MFIWNRPAFVGLISRPKLHGGGKHAGVMLPDGRVAHMTPDGAAIVSFADFAQGRPVAFDKPAPRERHLQMHQRAHLSAGRTAPYDLLTRNCEHYATWLMCEEPRSPQVALAFVVGVLGMLALAG